MENLAIEKRELVSQIVKQFPALNLAVCSDEMRPTMNFVKVKKRNDGFFWAEATNGHILAEINFSYFLGNCIFLRDLPSEFYLSPEAFKALSQRKAKWIKFNPETLVFKTLDKDFKTLSFFEAVSSEEFTDKIGRYPDTMAVWPDMANKTCVSEIGMNFSLLNDLGKCLIPSVSNLPHLKLNFFGKNRPMVCEVLNPEYSEVCKGLIMPICIID
jgi:hypothetical protein